MALINCPECNKEISDTTKSCPHCGYSIKEEITQTELGSVETNAAAGVMWICLGIVSLIIGLFTVGIIIGIFIIIGGLGFIGMGAANISGMQNGVCPYRQARQWNLIERQYDICIRGQGNHLFHQEIH